MPQPNILLILIDDLGARDLGCFGSTFYDTPVLDRLAAEGLTFQRAYASCPVCSPTRASIMSGKYPARLGLTQFIGGRSEGQLANVPYLHYLPLEERSIASALRDGGYQTWHVGKWHLGDRDFYPERHGFDINIAGNHWGMPLHGFFSPWDLPDYDVEVPDGTYLTDHLTDEACRLIRERDAGRPFFLNLSHYAVHVPIEAPAPLVERYRAKAAELGLDRVDPFVEGKAHGARHTWGKKTQVRVLQSDPTYAAMIRNLDTNIGRVLATLAEEGLAEETLVIFTSDNGGTATAEGSPTCNLPLAQGKGWNEEGGTRVCQFIRWPGVVRPGGVCRENVTSTDLYPTLLEAAGLPLDPQQHPDGVSLLPLLHGEGTLDRDCIFWHYPHYSNQGGRPAASLVRGDWKLIRDFEDESLRLYNLAKDPSESRNLAGAHPELSAELAQRLQQWLDEVEASIPERNPDWPPQQPKTPNNAHV